MHTVPMAICSPSRAFLGLAILLATAIASGGCDSPTLPLPPPSAEVSALSTDGTVTVSGNTLANAFVSCFNDRTERGVITKADSSGDYSLVIAAQNGDVLQIWVQNGNGRGPDVDRIVGDNTIDLRDR